MYIEQDVNRNKLCGGYDWERIGNAYTVTITDLGASFLRLRPARAMNIDWKEVCVTIPERRFRNGRMESVSATQASTRFNLAWTAALNKTLRQMNQNSSEIEVRNKILSNLRDRVKNSAPGSSITVGPCRGEDVKSTKATYCF